MSSNINYTDALRMIDEIAEKTKDNDIKNTSLWLRASIEKEHKPTMAIVCFNLNHGNQLALVKDYFGIDVPRDVVESIEGDPACLILDYCETPKLYIESGDTKIVLGLPYANLKKHRIAICDEIRSHQNWLSLSNDIDISCLVINATMAMTLSERTWLNDYVSLFSADELVLLNRIDQLNEESDVDAVRNTVTNALKKKNLSSKVFEKKDSSFKAMEEFLKNQNIQEQHNRRVFKNGLAKISNRLKELLNEVSFDETTISSAVIQLEKQQKRMELAGRLTSDSILCNALNDLKAQLFAGIRDYGQQMARDIKKKIDESPLDKLETMDDRISGYVSGSWDYYMKAMSAKVDSEMKQIIQKLTKQMEIDAGNMISELDDFARMTVYSALGVSDNEQESFALIDYKKLSIEGSILPQINVSTITDRIRKEIRNMMLLSIPLLFVNPLLSIGNIFASKLYGNYVANNELKNVRAEMANMIETACYENTESIIKKIDSSFEDTARMGTVNIQASYKNIISQITEKLTELGQAQKEKAMIKKYISEIVETTIPSYINNH